MHQKILMSARLAQCAEPNLFSELSENNFLGRSDENRPILDWIAGVDEAGRGALAGSVFAAAVILNPDKNIRGLNDSKKLSPKQRDLLAVQIKAEALAFGIGSASSAEIDEINILQATFLAMRRALAQINPAPLEVWLDGNQQPKYGVDWPWHTRCFIQGDGIYASIAAASILAKSARDAQMAEMAREFPEYQFEKNQGYGTAQHCLLIQSFGVSKCHRKTFKIKNNLNKSVIL